jgi:hypothetical protein
MKKIFLLITSILVLVTGSCGLMSPPAPPPQLSATDLVPRATAMSGLPPTWTPEPTFTPTNTLLPSPTPTATHDPSLYNINAVMTPVSVSYPTNGTDISGWKTIEGKTAAIKIPPSFEIMDIAGVFMEMMFGMMEAFTEGMMEVAEGLGEELGVTPETSLETPDLGEFPDFDFILAMEESTQSAIILVNVERGPETTTEYLLDEALTDSDPPPQPVSREVFTNAPYPMERVILNVEDEELGPGKQIVYVILGEEMAWNLVFGVSEGLYEEYLPIFEAVVDSFTPLQE